MMTSKPKKQPYIKVRYKVDHPTAGIHAGDVVPIAYRSWANVPAPVKAITELVEGPETLEELKENVIASMEELQNKIGEEVIEEKKKVTKSKATKKKKK